MAPKIIVVFTREGLESVGLSANTFEEQQIAKQIEDQVGICLEVADAILKKHSAGPRG
jgi:hypothetical protein